MTVPEPALVVGPTDPPLLPWTIGQALENAARTWGGRDALVVPGQGVRWTWAGLAERADRLAAGLLALGLEPGDRVGIWSPNRAEWTLTQFATARAGLVLVTINPAYQAAELDYALNKVGCRALVLAPGFKGSDYVGLLRSLAPEMADGVPLRAARLPALRHVILLGDGAVPGTIPFASLTEGADPAALAAVAARLSPDDAINIQFTSGTTGQPKGATLTHRNILNNGYFAGLGMALGPDDRICAPVPLYHCFGMVLGNLAAVTHGACLVHPGEGFDPLTTLRVAADERCTAMYGVPTMFIAMLDHPEFDRFDLSTLRTGIMGGAPCPVTVMEKVLDRMNMREVTIAYGMTETSPLSFQTPIDAPLDKRVGSVGRVHPHLQVRLADTDGNTVPRGATGELLTRGYSVMQGYWADPDKTAEAVDADGWMHTGDLAVIDEDGWCNIVGRVKDMVIRGGENIYPREVEEFLYRHPAIQDVQVFGVPDPKYGEALCAWIRPRDGKTLTEDDIRAFCQGQIAHFKVPRYIRFVTEFPMTVTGKIQKFAMREVMVAELGLTPPRTA
ncbi:AMP-binding protein [Niveispirillum sp.]|uniref:AMP-binding protein n=1 Tax=Niveispirillum sp. TaxID=1917217 RepID=UPI001B64E8B0|nr:AMP-binding protein [Niveispirillum sp.]MBP7334864.1 AMP-binding protein [Niveispirillum sp.]